VPSSEWLDIAIGVVLVWFLFSLVVSATNEAINRVLALRAKELWRGINRLVDGTVPPRGVWADAFKMAFDRGDRDHRPQDPNPHGAGAAQPSLTDQIYATQTVQSLESHPDPSTKTRIAHLAPAVFAQALIEVGARDPSGGPRTIESWIASLPAGAPLKPQLESLWTSASGDLNQFRANVERWFDGQMARISALYRAKVRIVLAVLGVVLAVAGFGLGLRSDALGLVSDLQRNQNLRTALVTTAGEATTTDLAALAGGRCAPTSTTATTTAASPPGVAVCQLEGVAKLQGFNLALERSADRPGPDDNILQRLGLIGRRPKVLLGVLITGIAISFGATFWFDALRRLVGLRNSGERTAS
jgi:hypothetical protein